MRGTENDADMRTKDIEARMDGDEEEFWTFSAQTMIAILAAFLTCVEVVEHSSSGEDC